MKYRHAELQYQKTLDDVGTWIQDLKTKDPISAMRFNFSGTNGSISNKSNFINDLITKIEIVDGSDQLISLSLKEAQAIQRRLTSQMPHMRPAEAPNVTQEESCLIQFGRWMWDKDYYLDLTKFKNPELKVSSNIAAVRAAGNTGFVSGSLKVTVDLHIIEEGAEPAKGFMMQKNIRSFTSATSGDEPTSLPEDYPYVGMLIRAYAEGNDVDENISKVKLDCDTGKFIYLEKYTRDLYRWEEEELGPSEMRYFLYRKDNETVYHPINHDPIVSVMGQAANDVINVNTCKSGSFILRFYTGNTGAPVTVEELLPFMVRGSCLHSTVFIPFGLIDYPETYFDPTKYEDIKLILTQAASSSVSICLVQLRPYA